MEIASRHLDGSFPLTVSGVRGTANLTTDVKGRLEDAYDSDDCSDPDVLPIKQMLFDGHCKAPDADIHALFATSDVAVSEQDHIKYVVWYNDTCADNVYERFDGIAVNNEAWNDVKCTTPAAEQAYLDDLQVIVDEAALQVTGTLATHYSIGWRWSFCDSVTKRDAGPPLSATERPHLSWLP